MATNQKNSKVIENIIRQYNGGQLSIFDLSKATNTPAQEVGKIIEQDEEKKIEAQEIERAIASKIIDRLASSSYLAQELRGFYSNLTDVNERIDQLKGDKSPEAETRLIKLLNVKTKISDQLQKLREEIDELNEEANDDNIGKYTEAAETFLRELREKQNNDRHD